MNRLRFSALLFGVIAFAVQAETIVPSEWARKVDITFSGYSGQETLTNFPALVRLSTEIQGFDYGNFKSTSAGVPADLRFADASGNSLDYEIDTWNPEGESLVWVRIPELTSTNKFTATKITAYYGKEDVVADPECAQGVWKDCYAGVWHMNTNSTETPIIDSTGNGFAGKAFGTTSQRDGILGKAFANSVESAKNSNTQNRIVLGDYSAEVDDATTFTVSGWFKHDKEDYANGRRLFCKKENNNTSSGYEIYMNTKGTNKIHLRGASTGTTLELDGVKSNVEGELKWFHVMAVYRGNFVDVYANGERISAEGGSSLGKDVTATANTWGLGVLNYGNGGAAGMQGAADEVRVSPTAFGADWAKAEYETATNAEFAEFGIVELAGESDKPIVTSTVASETGRTGFTANGQILSLGDESELALFLDYGTSEDELTTVTLPAATQIGLVAYALTDLLPSTKYVYRFRAQADSVTVESLFAEETTLPGEAVFGEVSASTDVESLTASVSLTELAVSESGTVVELYVTTDPANPGEAKKVFDAVATLDAATFEATVDGLVPNTAYTILFKATGVYQGLQLTTWSEPLSVSTGGRPSIEALEAQASVVDNNVKLRGEMNLMGGTVAVTLLVGETEQDLIEVETWTDLTTRMVCEKTVDLPSSGVVYYQFVAVCSYTPAGVSEPIKLQSETPVKVAGKVTWIGATDPATDNWRDLDNWDLKVLPTTRDYIAVIPAHEGDPTYARIGFSSSTVNNITNAAIVVGAGQTNVIDHQKWHGNVEWHVDAVRNAGTLEIRNGATQNYDQIAIFDEDTEGIINAEGASLRVIAPVTGTKNHRAIYRINAGIQNDGLLSIEHGEYGTIQGANNDAFARLAVVSAGGTITNNGTIRLYSLGNVANSGYAHLQFGNGSVDKQTYELAGTGRLFLDSSGRIANDGAVNEKAILVENNSKKHVIVNGENHTIEGAGYIKDLGLTNRGLIRAFDIVRNPENGIAPYSLQFRCYYNAGAGEFGARIENMPTGRMIAMETSGGLLLGNAEYRSTFFNHGLLEARTGSKIELRVGATESTAKYNAGGQVDEVALGGVIAGDGTIETHRPVVFKSAYTLNDVDYPAAIVRPGNLALNDDGEDDGLGASLPGILHFTTNVTFKAGSTLEIDGGRVNGVNKADGIDVKGAVTIEEGAKLRVKGKIPSGIYPLITSSLPIEGDFTVVKDACSPAVSLSKRSETVDEGSYAVTTYYLEAIVRVGLAVIFR